MPTYQYICTKCDHEFEVVQPIAAAPLSTCPKDRCGEVKWGKGKVRRQISGGAGLLFKGSGFYITDYRSDGYKQAAKKETDAASPKKETKESSTPAAPATPATPTPKAAKAKA